MSALGRFDRVLELPDAAPEEDDSAASWLYPGTDDVDRDLEHGINCGKNQ